MRYSYDRRTAGRLDSGLKRDINKALDRAGLGGKRKFRKPSEGATAALAVLSEHGLEQDDVVNADMFRSEQAGSTTIRVALSNPEDPFSPETITNSMLALSWTELRPGVVEVIAYMS